MHIPTIYSTRMVAQLHLVMSAAETRVWAQTALRGQARCDMHKSPISSRRSNSKPCREDFVTGASRIAFADRSRGLFYASRTQITNTEVFRCDCEIGPGDIISPLKRQALASHSASSQPCSERTTLWELHQCVVMSAEQLCCICCCLDTRVSTERYTNCTTCCWMSKSPGPFPLPV